MDRYWGLDHRAEEIERARAARRDPTGNESSAMLWCPICLSGARGQSGNIVFRVHPHLFLYLCLSLIADGTKRETRLTENRVE